MALTIKAEYLKKWIAGGWQFTQALPDNLGSWHAPDPLINTFRQQVANVVSWRKANPAMTVKLKLSTDWDAVEREMIAQNVARMQRLPKGEYYLTSDEPVPSPSDKKKPSLWSAVKDVAVAVVNGETPLQEWLGEGGVPVASEWAEQRASVCVDCPQNTRRHWSLFFTRPVAALFAKTVEERNRLKLSTRHDKDLGACKACGCVLELKVHVPMKHIEAHTKEEVWPKLWENCWMKKERAK